MSPTDGGRRHVCRNFRITHQRPTNWVGSQPCSQSTPTTRRKPPRGVSPRHADEPAAGDALRGTRGQNRESTAEEDPGSDERAAAGSACEPDAPPDFQLLVSTRTFARDEHDERSRTICYWLPPARVSNAVRPSEGPQLTNDESQSCQLTTRQLK